MIRVFRQLAFNFLLAWSWLSLMSSLNHCTAQTRPATTQPTVADVGDRLVRLQQNAKSVNQLMDSAKAGKSDLDWLAERAASDPEAEKWLATLAGTGPQYLGEDIITLSGRADEDLIRLRGQREVSKIIDGATAPKEQIARIQAAFQAHPEWTEYKNRTPAESVFLDLLVARAMDIDGDAAIGLAVETDRLNANVAKAHAKALLRYVSGRGPIHATARAGRMIAYLVFTQDPEASTLLNQWLETALARDPANTEMVSNLIGGIADLPGGHQALLRLASSANTNAAYEAASWLRLKFPDAESAEVVRQLLSRVRKDHESAERVEKVEQCLQAILAQIPKKS